MKANTIVQMPLVAATATERDRHSTATRAQTVTRGQLLGDKQRFLMLVAAPLLVCLSAVFVGSAALHAAPIAMMAVAALSLPSSDPELAARYGVHKD
ncbi:MAG: hypothetical protein AB1705_18450 [Verrucomicrobiota bacterium]